MKDHTKIYTMVHKELMNKRQLKAYEKLEAEADRLNRCFYVGETIQLIKDDDSVETDVIKAKFSIMCGSVVAWLETNGSFLAERVNKDYRFA